MLVFCHLLNDHSGSPVVLRATMEALKSHPDRLLFVGSQGTGVLEHADVSIRRYWYRRSSLKLLTLVSYLASQVSLYRALSRSHDIRPEAVLLVNTLLPIGAMIWGWRNRRTVLVHVHEVSLSPVLFQRFLVAIVRATTQHVIYVSQDNARRLPILGVPSSVVPNPIPLNISKAGEKVTYAPRRSGCFKVLMLTSLRDFKGVPELFVLARRVAGRANIRFELVLNADDGEIERYFHGQPASPFVVVQPRTAYPEHYYAHADVVVNLSRVDQWIETFGLTLLEAMSFGVPVIAPPVGGPVEIVRNGVDGFLIDSRDTDQLANVVLQLAQDPELAMKLSYNARLRAREFSFDKFAARILDVVNNCRPSGEKH